MRAANCVQFCLNHCFRGVHECCLPHSDKTAREAESEKEREREGDRE